jgi:hypothetical protein
MVALHPTTTANVDTRKHMDLHLCDSSRGSRMHDAVRWLAHAHTGWTAGLPLQELEGPWDLVQLQFPTPRPRGKDDDISVEDLPAAEGTASGKVQKFFLN